MDFNIIRVLIADDYIDGADAPAILLRPVWLRRVCRQPRQASG